MNAWTLESATPMSMPPATPTKPPAAPPATVNDLKKSTAETFTAWSLSPPPSWLTCELWPIQDFVVTWISVTPTPPATPTKPPPTLAASPKMSSFDALWTARPWIPPVWKPRSPFAS